MTVDRRYPLLKQPAHFDITSAERASQVTVVNDQYIPGDIRRYGGVAGTDCTAVLTKAASCNSNVLFPADTAAWVISGTPTIPSGVILQGLPGATFFGAGAGALGFNAAGVYSQILEPSGASGDLATTNYFRNAQYTGGTPGNTINALRLQSNVSAGVANFEWVFLSVLNNSATAGQNVAGYLQAKKQAGAGPTWSATCEARDTSGAANPTTGLIGIEVDVFADGGDSGLNRVGIDIVGGVGVSTGPTIGYGLRIGPQNGTSTNCNFVNGVYLYGTMTRGINLACSSCAVGIDTSLATLSAAALRMATGQFIGLDGSDLNRITFDGTGLVYRSSGNSQSKLNTDGSVSFGGSTLPVKLVGTTAAGATAGVSGAPPAQVAGYLNAVISGTSVKIPYYLA